MKTASCLIFGALGLLIPPWQVVAQDLLTDAGVLDARRRARAEMTREANSQRPLIDKSILEAKVESRDHILAVEDDRSSSAPADDIRRLIDPRDLQETQGRILRSPIEIDQRGYQAIKLSNDVWSSSAWNTYRGNIAQRYAEPASANASSWLVAWDFVNSAGRKFFEIATVGTPRAFDRLSPAEKYDLLIGAARAENPNGVFTRREWAVGERYQNERNTVPTWLGYCHGWAPASFSSLRPTGPVEVLSFDRQKKVRFYPADIKGLRVALWANALPRLRMLGRRCNETAPPRDENGRVISENCLDVNPGSFHMAVVNQVGVGKRNLLIDATYDAQVWNYPITSYSYRYFQPETGRATSQYNEAVIPLSSHLRDRFRRYRSSEAFSVVGVVLKIDFIGMRAERQSTRDSSAIDTKKSMTFVYDLEISGNGEIIGGEWHQTRHPDFAWSPLRGSLPFAQFEDEAIGAWNPVQSIPPSWSAAALRSVEKGQPLAKIVDQLTTLARGVSN